MMIKISYFQGYLNPTIQTRTVRLKSESEDQPLSTNKLIELMKREKELTQLLSKGAMLDGQEYYKLEQELTNIREIFAAQKMTTAERNKLYGH